MDKLSVFLLIVALVLALLRGFVIPNPQPAKPDLGWLAVAFLIMALVVRGLPAFGL
jgi:hypothetical protein